jgi:hypothetical protein
MVVDELIGAITRGGPGQRQVEFYFAPNGDLPPVLHGLEHFLGLVPKKVHNSLKRGSKKPPKVDGWGMSGNCVYEALYLMRSTMEVLLDNLPVIHSFPVEEQLGLLKTAASWQQKNFAKFAKYMTAWPMARYLENPAPEKPEGFTGSPLVWRGKIKRVLKRRLIAKNLANLTLWGSWLQGIKRGASEVSDSFILDEMIAHKKKLSTPPTGELPITVLPYVERMLKRFSPPTSIELYEASTSACWQNQRSQGGSRGFIRLKYGAPSNYNPKEKPLDYVYRKWQERCYPELLFMVETSPGVVVEVRGLAHPSWIEILHDASMERVPVEMDGTVRVALGSLGTPLNPGTRPTDPRLLDLDYKHSAPVQTDNKMCETINQTRVSAVLEPLKVRLITKGESLSYYLSKFFQRSLWGHLQKYQQFSLTGRPLDQTDLHGILEREAKCGISDLLNKWVSGDYKGATDTLDIRMTHLVFETAISKSNLPADLDEALRGVISKQMIHYPDTYVQMAPEALAPFKQANGQLMGSTLSFPILCMVNIIAYWASMEEHFDRSFRLEDLPCLVNGDDILFRSNDQHYEVWKKWVKTVGFTLSMGKNYIHPSVLTVNSELYKYNKTKKSFTKCEFLNCGLLMGIHKKTGRDQTKNLPIWDIYNATVPNSVDPVRTHLRFMHYHRAEIERLTMGYDPSSKTVRPGKFNIFLPRELGGLGFIPPKGLEIRITPRQITYGHYCMEKRREAEFNNELPKGLGVSLIPDTIEAGLTAPTMRRTTNLILWPATAPVERGMEPLQDYAVKLPPLACAHSVNDLTLKIQRPSRRNVTQAFKGKWQRLHANSSLNARVLMNYNKVFKEYRRPVGCDRSWPGMPGNEAAHVDTDVDSESSLE